MIDIVEIPQDGRDMGLADSAVGKAANILAVQIGSLEYAKTLGVDLKFFLESNFQFQNESFKAYLIERLTHSQINVSQVVDTIETFFEKFSFYVDDGNTNAEGLIR